MNKQDLEYLTEDVSAAADEGAYAAGDWLAHYTGIRLTDKQIRKLSYVIFETIFEILESMLKKEQESE